MYIQATLNAISTNALNNESSINTPFTQNGLDVYYTKNAFPTGSVTLLTVNYYDQYPYGPFGVDVEVAPFVNPSKVNLG